MKSGRTLQELAVELERQQHSKKDFIADTRKLKFCAEDDNVELYVDGVENQMSLRRTAHQQFATSMGIPGDYYRRMQDKAPDLLAYNLNHWLANEPSQKLVRTIDGQCRALLSNSYRPLDNFDLSTAVLPTLVEHDIEVQSCEITEDRFYLKAILPGLTEEIMPAGAEWGKGHDTVHTVEAGLVLSNSEVGRGSIMASPGIHTRQCTNLTVFSRNAMRKTHLGSRNTADEFVARYSSYETRKLHDAAFWNELKDFVVASLDGRIFHDLVDELKRARQNAIECSVPEVIEVVADQFSLREEEGSSVLDYLIKGGDLTQYGVQSAVTRASQDLENYDRASELEEIGGKIIELTNDQWSRVTSEAQKLTAV